MLKGMKELKKCKGALHGRMIFCEEQRGKLCIESIWQMTMICSGNH